MKVSREKNIVTIEVEPNDCPPYITPEMYADMILLAFQNSQSFQYKLAENINNDPELFQAMKESMKDFDERWEL